MTPDRFENREDAGRRLAAAVLEAGPYADPLVLALPRGGVPIAVHVARQLDAPLDLLLVRKIGLPRHEELAAGAVVGGAEPQVVQNPEIIRSAGLSEAEFDALRDQQLAEIDRRRALYGLGAAPPARGKDVVLVDDGIATGATVALTMWQYIAT